MTHDLVARDEQRGLRELRDPQAVLVVEDGADVQHAVRRRLLRMRRRQATAERGRWRGRCRVGGRGGGGVGG